MNLYSSLVLTRQHWEPNSACQKGCTNNEHNSVDYDRHPSTNVVHKEPYGQGTGKDRRILNAQCNSNN